MLRTSPMIAPRKHHPNPKRRNPKHRNPKRPNPKRPNPKHRKDHKPLRQLKTHPMRRNRLSAIIAPAPAGGRSERRTAAISPMTGRADSAKCARDQPRRLDRYRNHRALERRRNHRRKRAPRPNATLMSAINSTAPSILRTVPTSLMAAARVESAKDRRIAVRERLKNRSACRCASPVAGVASVSAALCVSDAINPDETSRAGDARPGSGAPCR
jgi:hypothetical protein